MTMARTALGIFLLAASIIGAQAQGATDEAASKPSKAKHKTEQQLEVDLQQLTAKYDRLEQEVAALKADAERREKELADTNKALLAAQKDASDLANQGKMRAEDTLAKVATQEAAVATLQSVVAELKGNAASLEQTIQDNQRRAATPDSISFMGIALKPGGFLAGETVDRQHGIGGDINTQFTGIPFASQTAGHLSEFNASGRQSRVSLLGEGKLSSGASLRGYFEGDFLSAGTTSNDNQSNSYTFRLRQAWAQSELKSGWIFTGGQMWSLATEYKSGLTNNQEQIPLTIDAQYNAGFTWERQYGFRVVKKIDSKLWAGVSVEAAQTLNLGGHNLTAMVFQQAGNSGGAYNSGANYSYNFVPDLVGKIVYEPRFGHFELYSIGRTFRARAFPDGTPMFLTTSYNFDTTSASACQTAGTGCPFSTKASGGGLGVNARVRLFGEKMEIGVHGQAGDGLGRYSTATLPDATERPDGTLELLSGGSALGSLEWHATHRLDLYGYYGGEYAKRAWYPTGFLATTPTNPSVYDPPAGQPILAGYGAPTNVVWGCNLEVNPVSSANGGGDVPGSVGGCFVDNRNIQEGTFGYWYRFYKGPKGTLQQGIQYSYAVRHTWQGIGLPANPVTGAAAIPGSPEAIDNMWFTSFRYYLPR